MASHEPIDQRHRQCGMIEKRRDDPGGTGCLGHLVGQNADDLATLQRIVQQGPSPTEEAH